MAFGISSQLFILRIDHSGETKVSSPKGLGGFGLSARMFILRIEPIQQNSIKNKEQGIKNI